MTTMDSPAIYIRNSSGFGNKVFDLISAVYLKNKYGVTIYFAIDKSIHDKPEDPFFGKIFYKSYQKVKYIYLKKYYYLRKKLPITEMKISSLDDFPEKITTNYRFGRLYRLAYVMYETFNDDDKKIFEINPKLINKQIKQKYIKDLKMNYACIHIRYGDKLCYAYEGINQTKYTHYMFPLYTPEYFISQINELLKKDIAEILVMTDTMDVVKKYITDNFLDNPRVKLLDSHYINSFYLLTKAKYIVLSHSTFSFSAAYFNEKAICYLVKKYLVDPKLDYIPEDNAISPKWIIIDNKNYILNFNKTILKNMIEDFNECDKYIK